MSCTPSTLRCAFGFTHGGLSPFFARYSNSLAAIQLFTAHSRISSVKGLRSWQGDDLASTAWNESLAKCLGEHRNRYISGAMGRTNLLDIQR